MPRMRAVSMSVALTRNTVANGPLMLIPGSHNYFVPCLGRTPPRHFEQSLRKQQYGVPDHESLQSLVARSRGIEVATGPAGSVTMFDCNTMHGSSNNISPDPRTNLFIVFNSDSNRLQMPSSGQPPRPEHIAARTHAPRLDE